MSQQLSCGTSLDKIKYKSASLEPKHIKNLLDIFEGTVEKRCAVYELADDEDDENRAAAECNAAKNQLILAIEQLVHTNEKLMAEQKQPWSPLYQCMD